MTVAPGFLAARAIGRGRGTVALMREAVLSLRRLLAGEPAEFEGRTSRLLTTTKPPTPVYLLAAGPRMVELAGEVADGAMLMVGLHPAAIRAARQHLEAGARRAGRSLTGFPVIFIATIGLAICPPFERPMPPRIGDPAALIPVGGVPQPRRCHRSRRPHVHPGQQSFDFGPVDPAGIPHGCVRRAAGRSPRQALTVAGAARGGPADAGDQQHMYA